MPVPGPFRVWESWLRLVLISLIAGMTGFLLVILVLELVHGPNQIVYGSRYEAFSCL